MPVLTQSVKPKFSMNSHGGFELRSREKISSISKKKTKLRKKCICSLDSEGEERRAYTKYDSNCSLLNMILSP